MSRNALQSPLPTGPESAGALAATDSAPPLPLPGNDMLSAILGGSDIEV